MTADAVSQAYVGRVALALAASSIDEQLRAWLHAYLAAAQGRFDAALTLALPRAHAGAPAMRHRFALTAGSALRQISRYRDAAAIDLVAARCARTAEQRAHALISLAADAVGSGDASRCGQLLAQARPACASWRARVRWRWVAAELAFLTERAGDALDHARLARADAARADAVRHEAKSLLFEGVARAELGDPDARATLLRAQARAVALGATPIARAAGEVLAHHPGAVREARPGRMPADGSGLDLQGL